MATFSGLRTGMSAVLLAFLAIALAGTLFAGRNQWTPVGPEGGAVAALAADPQNPSTVYAATCAGVFKTVDGGANWSAVNSGLPGIDCQIGPGILAVDPQNTGTVYVSSGNQIFKTTHGGASWNAISTPKVTAALQVLLIAPSNPNTLYTSDGSEIFKSTDGGATWAQTGSGTGFPLALDPQNQDTLYANMSGGLFKTTDGGASWNPANSGLPPVAQPAYNARVLVIDPWNPDTLYAAGFRGQIFKSTDGGTSWNPASFGLPPSPAPSAGYNSVVSLAINPQTPAVIYALIRQPSLGSQGYFFLATSTDGAASWTLDSDPLLAAAGLYTIAPDPRDAGTLYLGTSNGILKTADAGGHWSLASGGLRAAGIESVVIDPQTAGTLFAVTSFQGLPMPAAGGAAGLFKSTNGGNSWSPSNFGLQTNAGVPVGLAADPQHPGTLYALEVISGALFQSEDSAGSWVKIWSNTTPNGTDVGPLAIDPQNPNIMYLAFNTCLGSCDARIAKSTDGGHTWTKSQVALKGMGCCSQIDTVAVDPQNPNIVYAGTADGDNGGSGLWKSTDGGVSWTNLGAADVYATAIDPRNPGTIYAVWNGSLAKSTDGGQTWNADFGLGLWPVGPLVIDPQNSATIYCVGYDGTTRRDEIFRSTDAGASWTEVGGSGPSGSGLRGFVNSLTLDPQDPRTLHAATDSGLFAITLDAPRSRNVR